MKARILQLILIIGIAGNVLAASHKLNPIVGTWKYTKESIKNDFQQVSNSIPKTIYTTEYFIFEPNNKFRHEFVNEEGAIVKSFGGKWKLVNDKIKIAYNDIDYNLSIDYFFLDQDLVLGQNFNHVIFSKDVDDVNDKNIASVK